MTDEISKEGSGGAASTSQITKTFTEDQLNAILAERERQWKEREAELQAKAKKWDEYESKGKSEIQKAQEAAAKEAAARLAAEKERDALKLEKMKAAIGKKYNIPPADWDRLRGTDEKSIEADAKEWAKARGLDRTGGATPPGMGPSTPNENAIMNNMILRAAGRGGR
jgi:hypothetical protein